MPGISEHHTEAILDVTSIVNTSHLARYTENLWIKRDQPTSFKLLLGHDEPTINFSSNQLLTKLVDLGSQVKLYNIQLAKTSCVGCLIGSSPSQDTQMYSTLLKNNPKLMNYNIDCKIDLVKMTPSKKYQRETAARAMFVYTDEKSHKVVLKD